MNAKLATNMVAYPRPQGTRLLAGQLHPADVLLSRGEGRISDLVVEADGGSYSHAALWSGSGIIEATLKDGVVERPAAGRRDVYRYRRYGQELTCKVAEKIVEAARKHVGNKYDSAEIHMLSVVFSRAWPFKRPRRALASGLLELFGGHDAPRLQDWLQRLYARSAPRICSELVALAYYEAEVREDRTRPYALLTVAPEQRPSPPASDLESDDMDEGLERELELLKATVEDQLWNDPRAVTSVAAARNVSEREARGLLFGQLALDAATELPVSVVSPGDLQFSPSLSFVGVFDP